MDLTNFVYARRESELQLGDYASYRVHLARQLAAIRKRLGRTTPKNSKYQKQEPILAEDIGRNHEFAHLFLLSSERAWAHAMQMKSAHAEDNGGSGFSASTRTHIVSRLTKAAKQAKELADLLFQRAAGASQNDWLQAAGYAYTLAGTVEFEKHASGSKSSDAEVQRRKWQACLANFSAARVLYAALLKSSKMEVFKDVLAGTIDPSIRYAAYQSHIPRTVAVTAVARRFFPREDTRFTEAVEELDESEMKPSTDPSGKSTDGNIPTTITWRKRIANIADASIGQALANVAAAQDRLTSFIESSMPGISAEEKAAAYDEVLIASQDAADATRHVIDDHKKEGISEGDPRMQDLRITNLAVNYDLVGWRVGRNRVLIGPDDGAELTVESTRKPKRRRKEAQPGKEREEGPGRKLARLRERVVLYDAILQSIDSVKDLPGAAEPSFREELEGKRSYFQALKCLNIAYSHGILSNPKNALALLLRAESLSSTALSRTYMPSSSPASVPKLEVTPESMKLLHKTLQDLINHYRGLVELANLEANSALAAQKHMASAVPLVERLNEYPPGGVDLANLVTYPPKLKPVPVKPLFLDLAWNYIDYPGRTPVANGQPSDPAAGKDASKEQKKSGWGWFGRS